MLLNILSSLARETKWATYSKVPQFTGASKPMCHFNFDIPFSYYNIFHEFSLLGLSQIFLLDLPFPNPQCVTTICERDTFNSYFILIISYNSGIVDLDLGADRCNYLYLCVTLKKKEGMLSPFWQSVAIIEDNLALILTKW